MPTIILRPGEANPKDIQLVDVSSGISATQTVIYLDALEAVATDIELRDPTAQPAVAAAGFTGTRTGTLSQIVGAATATHGVVGSIAGTSSLVTGSVTADHGVTGSLAGSATQITGAIVGELVTTAVLAGDVSLITGDVVAEHEGMVVPSPVGGGGGGIRPRNRWSGRRWRDPLYLTAKLQAEIESGEAEETDEEFAAEVIAEAITVFGGLLKPAGGLVKLPDPPKAVVQSVVMAPVIQDWQDIIEAIKEAQRQAATKLERKRIKRYREKIEAARVEIARRVKNEDESIEFLMAGGWL